MTVMRPTDTRAHSANAHSGNVGRGHWVEFLAEAAGLGLFMVSACAFGTLLGHPRSPVVAAWPDALVRRALMGVAMGATAILLITSPWGQRSGAHFNPATTLMFWRLGKVATSDAIGYALAQTLGGVAGVLLAARILGDLVSHPEVNYVATAPGPAGVAAALAAEVGIAFVLMTTVLRVSNSPRLARYTAVCVGALVAIYITLEAPVSGMSMNPARSLASAVPSHVWAPLWIYLVAPPAGMLLAAELHVRRGAGAPVFCAKLHHDNPRRCIFRCHYAELAAMPPGSAPVPAAALDPRT